MRAASSGLRHPASASCLGRHSRLAGRCPNNSSLFPPLAAVVVVAAERLFIISQFWKICGFSRIAFSRVGSWRETAFAAPLSAKARRCGKAGEDPCGEYPFSLAALASSPKGAPFGAAAKFSATAEAVPLGKVAKPQALTEGVSHGSKLPQSRIRSTAPSRMGPLAWRESSRLNCKVSGFARGSLPEGAGKAAGFD